MIEFLWPMAIAFLPLPLLVYWVLPKASRQEPALQVPFFGLAASYDSATANAKGRSILKRLLLILIWAALVLSATRPQWIGEPISLPTSGRDLLLAVDISGSMGTEDMQIEGASSTRLAVVKDVVGDFVVRRKGDRLGLILFGTRAYLQTPLTFDRHTVRTLLTETPLGIAGGKTAIGDAIGLAVKRLQARPAENRVLVLLTDGVNNVGEVDPTQAAKLAAQEGIRIYTIGFGADEMVVPGFLFQRKVNPSAELDVETLTEIAELTGGLFQRARSSQELEAIYEALDELEPIEQDLETYRPVRSLFWYPLAFALLSSLTYCLLHPSLTIWFYGLWPWARRKEAEPS
jgi:Ca-activated chloride channel family protein